MDGATLSNHLVKIVKDPLGEKGDIVVLTQDVCANTPLVIESPVLLTAKIGPQYHAHLQTFVEGLKPKCTDDAESVIGLALVTRWLPTLHSYARAPPETRAKILAMQTQFADSDCLMASAASSMGKLVHESGLFNGADDSWEDFGMQGVALTQSEIVSVITSVLVNAVDAMPDGSEAVFDVGLRFEHSCVPNSRLVISLSHKMPVARGASHLPPGTWIAEWRSTRAIAAGEAATMSYLGDDWLARTGAARRGMLHMKMGFTCHCLVCKNEIKYYSDAHGHNGHV